MNNPLHNGIITDSPKPRLCQCPWQSYILFVKNVSLRRWGQHIPPAQMTPNTHQISLHVLSPWQQQALARGEVSLMHTSAFVYSTWPECHYLSFYRAAKRIIICIVLQLSVVLTCKLYIIYRCYYLSLHAVVMTSISMHWCITWIYREDIDRHESDPALNTDNCWACGNALKE